ncbi:MAG TPA: GNAT family N-acetyltransferase [Polyangiaceae bacterium]|nr:GNAT family N-acetyltransferase [Polyangiaceae bacterium]
MSSSGFEVRLARGEDLPLLGPLELRAAQRFRDSPHPDCVDMAHFELSRLAELSRAGSVWVATDTLAGPIGFVIAEALDDDGYVHELDVEQAYGGRGVGRALLRRVAEWAKARGLRTLLLSTFNDVAWNAPFYQRLGFVLVPLSDYTPRMLAQRHSDIAAGMRAASRVMLRAPVAAVLLATRA